MDVSLSDINKDVKKCTQTCWVWSHIREREQLHFSQSALSPPSARPVARASLQPPQEGEDPEEGAAHRPDKSLRKG